MNCKLVGNQVPGIKIKTNLQGSVLIEEEIPLNST